MQNRQSDEIRVTAKTVEAAIKEAANTLGVDISAVEHRVVSQTNGGFFSFLAKKVEIAAWTNSGPKKSSGYKGVAAPKEAPSRTR